MRLSWFILLLLFVFALPARGDTASSASIAKTEASSGHRYLRKHTRPTFNKDDETFGERTIGIKLPSAAIITNLIKSGEQALTKLAGRSTSEKQKTTESLFQNLNVGAAETKLFERAPYQKWVGSVSNIYKKKPQAGEAAIFRTLVAHYGDETLANLLAQARQVSTTESIAKQFETIQLDNWITQRKTADEIYSLLKLDAVDNIFTRPSLETLISYVTGLQTADPYDWLAVKLTKRYGEDGLAHMVAAAKPIGSPGEISAMLVRETEHSVLENPAIKTWVAYATELDWENAYMLMFSVMQRRYSNYVAEQFWVGCGQTADDAFNSLKLEIEKRFGNMDLARVLFAAEKNATIMKETITSLRTLQFQKWCRLNWQPDKIAIKLAEQKDTRNRSVFDGYRDFYANYYRDIFKRPAIGG
ncbi:hypothetical protein PC118_g23021 [Phytophthora cactorum]|uniref:RxLR effector protein n=1 Tax=Phytophthora cactorum TaxID=29920 RepID=A0A8T1EY42_9STRA|nr:hypothetical protein PC114_g24470 [Phytophthora cactorum]KAG2882883.1 hypothetical protein PC115_g21816 [Phytophthora cactorum]KAG2959436.1 hypothetical protein PC118_g23021 [Phytophthora cactorum]